MSKPWKWGLAGLAIAGLLAGGYLLAHKGDNEDPSVPPGNESTSAEVTEALPEPTADDIEEIEDALNSDDPEAVNQIFPEGGEVTLVSEILGEFVIDPSCIDPVDSAGQCPGEHAGEPFRSYDVKIVDENGKVIEEGLELVLFYAEDDEIYGTGWLPLGIGEVN